MIKHKKIMRFTFAAAVAMALTATPLLAQEPGDPDGGDAGAPAAASPRDRAADGSPGESRDETSFSDAKDRAERRLEESVAELKVLRDRIAEEKIPLSRKLRSLERELALVREQFEEKERTLDTRRLDVSNLKKELKQREDELGYLSDLFGQYVRNFESRLHIAEIQRYETELEEANLAPDDSSLGRGQVLERQLAVLNISFDRLEDALGGALYEGAAVDDEGNVKNGSFVLVGPAAVFRSDDAQAVGLAEERLGSLQPTIVPFKQPEVAAAAAALVESGEGEMPVDPTLGNAVKIQATEETILEHIQKGGLVMIPIFTLAGAAFLVAIFKWVSLLTVRSPSRRKVDALLAAAKDGDEEAARDAAGGLRGPMGTMLRTGVEHFKAPRELIEEAMYEKVLATRIKLQRMLPFIAITAASAPLLGLLGTVTGIIKTFNLIEAFGGTDVQMLSGGISEALITTEFGLIVAVPTLLIHALLSRKARGVVDEMEKSAVALANHISYGRDEEPAATPSSSPPVESEAGAQGHDPDEEGGSSVESAPTPESEAVESAK